MMPRGDRESWTDERLDALAWRAEMAASRRTLKRMTVGICATHVVGSISAIVLILTTV